MSKSYYEQVYTVVMKIPEGQVATYGQIAQIVGGCTPRMVGYAMAALPAGSKVPWHRVVNRLGQVSPRANHISSILQRQHLEAEGVLFNDKDRLDLSAFRWTGPDEGWLISHSYQPKAD